jgi:hypothetical protein
MSIADVVPQRDTARSTRGRVPVSRVLVNNEPFEVSVTSASLSMGDGTHDEARLSMTSDSLTTTADLVDKPISFVWGVAPHSEFFHGYITEVTEDSQGATGALTFSLAILGPTKVMFEGYPKFWSGKSATSAINDIVNKNLLGFAGHPHEYLWSALAQTDESDWEMINNFANRIGWRLWNRYGVVGAYDPTKLFREAGTYARLVMGTELNVSLDRNLLEFQPNERSKLLKENLGVKYGYFTTSHVVQVVKEVGDFRGYRFATDIVVDNQDAATVYTTAATNSMDSWKQFALARCWGDADLWPGMCVEVVSTNSRYLRAKYDGKWLIRATSHSMDRQQFQTMLALVRPDAKTSVATGAYRPFWQDGVGRSRPTLSLVGDEQPRWRSSWSNAYAGSVT